MIDPVPLQHQESAFVKSNDEYMSINNVTGLNTDVMDNDLYYSVHNCVTSGVSKLVKVNFGNGDIDCVIDSGAQTSVLKRRMLPDALFSDGPSSLVI